MILTVHSRLVYSPRLRTSIAIIVLSLLMALGYALFGHTLVKALYDSDSSVANRLMSGRQQTPLVAYFPIADQTVLKVSIFLLSIAFAIASRNPFGIALSAMSIFVTSLLFFLLLDTFPPLASALHFDSIPYFNFRAHHLPDPELGFVNKPLHHSEDHNFRGWAYSTAYGVDMPPETVIIHTDEDGFRNQPGVSLADVVILGSSFPGYGHDLEDTYTKKLEKHLKGLIVANVAMGGYGPIEFLKAFQRFGLRKKPKYAILTFETEDLGYLDTDVPGGAANKRIENLKIVYQGTFWRRWRLALEQAGQAGWSVLSTGFSSMLRSDASQRGIHPDLVILRLPGNQPQPMIFPAHHTGLASEDLLNLPAWRQFEQVLIDFKNISDQNQVVPVLAYIPFVTEAYSEYTTLESGVNWLAMRDKGIATSGNDEKAVQALAERVGIEMISFLPAFKDAARQGKLVYYRFDNHWNSEGSEIAARVTADALRAHIDGAVSSSRGSISGIAQPVELVQP